MDVSEGGTRLLTVAAVYELVADRGWKLLAEGQLSPSVRETMDAVRVVAELDAEAESKESVEDIKAQFRQIIGAIRKHVPIEYWQAIEREVWTQGLRHRGVSAQQHDGERELEDEIAGCE